LSERLINKYKKQISFKIYRSWKTAKQNDNLSGRPNLDDFIAKTIVFTLKRAPRQ